MPPELLAKLGTLGYVSVARRDAKSAGADPKDKLDEYKALTALTERGLVALRSGRPAEAVTIFRGAAERGVDDFLVHFYLASAYSAEQQWRHAAAEYREAVTRESTYVPAWRGLGESLVALGDASGAVAAFEKVAALAPAGALGLVELGQAYRDAGRMTDAVRVLRQAVTIDPRPAGYWNALGTALGGAGQIADAERAFSEALTRDARDPNFAFNHGIALERLGRREEAVADYQRAASMGFAPARARLAQLGVR
jgi:tetratricopeptide (TPR) repeat protein